jgi:small subunit ribosomal protein S17
MTAKQGGVRGKVRDGTVVSDKMQKTIVVAIESNFRHRLYKKTVRRIRRFMAHDEREEAHLGDRVRIVETSPVSRRKRWRLLDVLVKAELPEVAPESIDLELLGEVKAEEPETDEAVAAAEPAAVPEEAVSSPEAEAVVPEEVEVAEEVPDIEPALEEEAGEEAGPAAAEAGTDEAVVDEEGKPS